MKYSIEDSTMTAIADALRAKTGTTAQLQPPNDYVTEIEKLHSDEWVLPDGWYDIESLPLTDDELCLYFLYDCRTSVRYADFWLNYARNVTYQMAKIIDGDLTNWETSETDLIELPTDCDYVVIKVLSPTLKGSFVFRNYDSYGLYSRENNIDSNQPCVWYYGKISPANSADLYANQNGGIGTSMLERVTLIINDNVTLGYGIQNRRIRFFNLITDSVTSSTSMCYIEGAKTLNVSLSKIYIKNRNIIKFRGCRNIKIDTVESEDGYITLRLAFDNNRSSKFIHIKANGIKVTSMEYSFRDNQYVEDIILDGFDFSECTSFEDAFTRCYRLENLRLGGGIVNSLYLAHSCCLTHESLLDVIDKLSQVESAKTLTLGSVNKAKLTIEEIAIATQKGWTVA